MRFGPLGAVLVDHPAGLVDQIRGLLAASLRPSTEFPDQILMVQQAIRLVTPSYVGLRLTMTVDWTPVMLELVEDKADRHVRSSLWMPISEPDGDVMSELTIFAGTAGALVDLAADVAYVWSQAGAVQLDQHLDELPTQSRLSGVDEFTIVNQAIGVLMDRGLLPDHALDSLTRAAARFDVSVYEAALALLAGPDGGLSGAA